jgi:hypothetical protein
MRTILILASLTSALALAAGCGSPMALHGNPLVEVRDMAEAQAPRTARSEPAPASESESAAGAAPSEAATAVDARKVVYTGSFALLVPDVAVAVGVTRKAADDFGGYLEHATLTSVVVRVPAARFDEAVAALKGLGAMTEAQVDAQDVGAEYEDLDIRLRSAKATLDKLLAILAKADSVKDALEVEREAARVRTEIEKLEGQMSRLAHHIAYATLSVRFTPMKEAPRELKATLPFYWLRNLGLDHLAAVFQVP